MLIWDINDHFVEEEDKSESSNEANDKQNRILKSLQNYLGDAKPNTVPTLQPKIRLEGHTDMIDDLCFNPTNDRVLVSVSRDKSIILWDERAGTAPISKVSSPY